MNMILVSNCISMPSFNFRVFRSFWANAWKITLSANYPTTQLNFTGWVARLHWSKPVTTEKHTQIWDRTNIKSTKEAIHRTKTKRSKQRMKSRKNALTKSPTICNNRETADGWQCLVAQCYDMITRHRVTLSHERDTVTCQRHCHLSLSRHTTTVIFVITNVPLDTL